MADNSMDSGNASDEEMEMMEDVEESGDSEYDDDDENDDKPEEEAKAYLPGQPIEEDEELVCDESAYVMYHQAQTGAPCLSFDVLPDQLGDKRTEFPHTLYVACGTQAQRAHANHVIVMKMSNLRKNKGMNKDDKEEDDDDEEDSDDDSEDEDAKPELETAMIKHNGGVNRLRQTNIGGKQLAATWSELGKVYIWDLSRQLQALNDFNEMAAYTRNEESPPPLFTFAGHQTEGFALDWSKLTAGKLLTGDCIKNIHQWTPHGASWLVDQRPFTGHTASVEDIQWSPNEANVFASCSVDKSIRIWDARAAPSKACMLTTAEAHDRDVNVINWNTKEPFIVSGGDDGMIKIWDLRQFQSGKAVAVFKHHTAPVTSVEWNPHDSTVFAAAGSDDQITLWDLAVERDSESDTSVEPSVPPQLLFIHQGQTDIKELHWHGQIPGCITSTAHSGFNVFRTISV